MGSLLYLVFTFVIMGVLGLVVMYVFASLERDLRKQDAARREKGLTVTPDKRRKAA
ncbi:MAG: hypothetical protein Q8P22_08080 [Chloroflexota bacterium]|nr:hypothetical protein [Chloroflexota bacterium]